MVALYKVQSAENTRGNPPNPATARTALDFQKTVLIRPANATALHKIKPTSPRIRSNPPRTAPLQSLLTYVFPLFLFFGS